MNGNKVYYGEYTLAYWIKLILSGNIVIPEFQRAFKWNKNEVKKLLRSLDKGYFVPPVVIGAYGQEVNYLIDGQQRLTSTVLAYFNAYPAKSSQVNSERIIINDNDDTLTTATPSSAVGLSDLQKQPNISYQHRNCLTEDNRFETLFENGEKIPDEEFFNSHTLAFCYLVPLQGGINSRTPTVKAKEYINKYFSSVFFSINSSGRKLDEIESRRALYFLDKRFIGLFEPDFTNSICVVKPGAEKEYLDFVRYLALISEFSRFEDVQKVFNTSISPQDYYLEFIYSVIGEEPSDKFMPLDPKTDLSKLKDYMKALGIYTEYSSIIEVDVMLFGLVYSVVFQNRTIDINRKHDLMSALHKLISEFKANERHTKNPAQKGFLRDRIGLSIELYKNYWLPRGTK